MKFLDYLDTRPYLSHSLLAALDSAILIAVMIFFVPLFWTCVLTATIVSAFFYGREAGQLDHDLSRAGTGTVFSRVYTSNIFLFWGQSEIMQWVFPALTSAVLSALVYLITTSLK